MRTYIEIIKIFCPKNNYRQSKTSFFYAQHRLIFHIIVSINVTQKTMTYIFFIVLLESMFFPY